MFTIQVVARESITDWVDAGETNYSRKPMSGRIVKAAIGSAHFICQMAFIIVVESAKPETKIGFWEYFRVGLPITVMTLIVGWAWLEWVK
jgi:hypothetical protein